MYLDLLDNHEIEEISGGNVNIRTMDKGAIHKLRLQEEGGRWPKKLTFCKLLYHRNCKRTGVGGQKKAKSCKRSL